MRVTKPSPEENRDNDGASGTRLRDLPEWLEEFTENHEDTEVLAPARSMFGLLVGGELVKQYFGLKHLVI